MEEIVEISKAVSRLRESIGRDITQAQLGEMLGVKGQAVSNYENGKPPAVEVIGKLAKLAEERGLSSIRDVFVAGFRERTGFAPVLSTPEEPLSVATASTLSKKSELFVTINQEERRLVEAKRRALANPNEVHRGVAEHTIKSLLLLGDEEPPNPAASAEPPGKPLDQAPKASDARRSRSGNRKTRAS